MVVFAPFEFVVTILVGVFLYLACAVFIYLNALRGLFERAVTLIVLRFRVGRVFSSADEKREAPPLSEIAAHRADGEERFRSWLN